MKPRFKETQKVQKRLGYPFPGTVVSVFNVWPERGEPLWRYVVRCDAPDTKGMLHIYNDDQLEAREDDNECTGQKCCTAD